MPGYFKQHCQSLTFTRAAEEEVGLRRAQLGASHALASHFTISKEPALVSMPTGTGKTAVLMLCPFLLEARRALVVTPSRMVRDQIVEGFANLKLLKDLGVLPSHIETPRTTAVESRIQTSSDWGTFNDFEVVVATPMGSSPAIQQIPVPPNDLFDLLLVDEAHHSPAATWSALIDAFPDARCVMFTATPFRRDKKKLRGRFVYEFPLREALKDGVFGQIDFVGCETPEELSNDEAIARKAEEVFEADKLHGLDHRVMVRTDSRTRAAELARVYSEETSLKLATIHGQHTLKHVRRTVERLKSGELDGIICVDMFGEGFDLPQLKIAAIHSPHKSLSVTLQFIGRFARTSGNRLGSAKFIAIPEEIQAETQILYEEGAVWSELVPNLADSRVSAEREIREQLATFERPDSASVLAKDLDLSSITPWYHCKVFRVSGTVELDTAITLRLNETLEKSFFSHELACIVFVVRKTTKPRWLEAELLQDVEYSLCVAYFDSERDLLFINSTEKTEDYYAFIAKQLVTGVCCGVPSSHISRALRMIEAPVFYSVGLKNRLLGSSVESYRILAGSQVDGAVSNLDSQLFDRGHVFGGGDSIDGKTTLGVSTLSKVWSNRAGLVPEFVAWCRALAEHLANSAPVVTGSRIDLLAVGEEVNSFPAFPVAVSWHEVIYKQAPRFYDTVGFRRKELMSLELRLLPAECGATCARVNLIGFEQPVRIRYTIESQPNYVVEYDPYSLELVIGKHPIQLEEYLNTFGLHFYLADFSRLFNGTWYCSNLEAKPIDSANIDCRDWIALGVDIEREFGSSPNGTSIHAYLEGLLALSSAEVVIYDHRPGEVADFVSVERSGGGILCNMYHCKGADGPRPGARVSDAYEVAGQIVKSVSWAKQPSALRSYLTRRLADGSRYAKGDLSLFEQLLGEAERLPFVCRLIMVQPGISHQGLSEPVAHILASSQEYVIALTGYPPVYWLSE